MFVFVFMQLFELVLLLVFVLVFVSVLALVLVRMLVLVLEPLDLADCATGTGVVLPLELGLDEFDKFKKLSKVFATDSEEAW